MNLSAKEIKPYKDKDFKSLERLAQKHFNSFIRRRDMNTDKVSFTCISCGAVKPISKMHAGHFYSSGHYPILRFHEDNVNGQCHRCNRHLHGNLIGYRERLVKKIGQERMCMLEHLAQRKRYRLDRWTLIEKIIHYKNLNSEKYNQQNSDSDHSSSRRMHWQ